MAGTEPVAYTVAGRWPLGKCLHLVFFLFWLHTMTLDCRGMYCAVGRQYLDVFSF